jgi:hypothetical protein
LTQEFDRSLPPTLTPGSAARLLTRQSREGLVSSPGNRNQPECKSPKGQSSFLRPERIATDMSVTFLPAWALQEEAAGAAYALRFPGIEITLARLIFAALSRPTPGSAEKVCAMCP